MVSGESLGSTSLFTTVLARGRLRDSSRLTVGHWISVHSRTFCVELPVLNEWLIVDFEPIRDGSPRPSHFSFRDVGFPSRPPDEGFFDADF
jgi:hypothetical protein